MSTVVESPVSAADAAAISREVAEDTPSPKPSDAERNAAISKANADAEARSLAIAEEVSKGFLSESERNLRVGRMVYDDALATREAVSLLAGVNAEWTTDDYKRRLELHRTNVRLRGMVAVTAKEIRIELWALAAILRMLLESAIGADLAHALTYFELRELSRKTRALSFSESTLEASINAGWIELIRGIAQRRASGKPLPAEKFETLVQTRQEAIAEEARLEAEKKDPEALRRKEEGILRRQQRAKMKRLNESFTESGISRIEEGNGEVTVSTLLSDVAAIAKHVGKTVDPLCFLRGGALKKRHLGAILQLIQDIPSREARAEMLTYLRDRSAEALAAMESSADESDDTESATVPMVAAS